MAIDRKQGEAYKPGEGRKPSGDNVEQLRDASRIVAARGPRFLEDFMQGMVAHERRDMAKLYVATFGKEYIGDAEAMPHLIEAAWSFADDFMLAEGPSLENRISDYFKLYIESSGKLSEIIEAGIEDSKDYSL